MLKYLAVGALALPFIDMYVLFEAAQTFGLLEVTSLVLATGLIGAWAVKREGAHVLLRLKRSVTPDEASGNMIEAVLLTVGGIALLTPGFITDLAGVILVGKPTRQRIMLHLRERFSENVQFRFEMI